MDNTSTQRKKSEKEKATWETGKKACENTTFSCKVNISKTKIAHDQRLNSDCSTSTDLKMNGMSFSILAVTFS